MTAVPASVPDHTPHHGPDHGPGHALDHAVAARPRLLARFLMLPIRAYRLVSVHLPPRCRYFPSCSAYALEALEVHGAGRGTWLAVKRVGRCHPWHDGGLDPVPPARAARARRRDSQPNVCSHDAAPPAAEETDR